MAGSQYADDVGSPKSVTHEEVVGWTATLAASVLPAQSLIVIEAPASVSVSQAERGQYPMVRVGFACPLSVSSPMAITLKMTLLPAWTLV